VRVPGTRRLGGAVDLEALEDYFTPPGTVDPAPPHRTTVLPAQSAVVLWGGPVPRPAHTGLQKPPANRHPRFSAAALVVVDATTDRPASVIRRWSLLAPPDRTPLTASLLVMDWARDLAPTRLRCDAAVLVFIDAATDRSHPGFPPRGRCSAGCGFIRPMEDARLSPDLTSVAGGGRPSQPQTDGTAPVTWG
jgi:hypothetical protein